MHNTAPLGSVSTSHNSSYHCCDTRLTLWFPALTHRLGCISPIFSLKSPIGSPPSTSTLTLTGLNCCFALWNPAFNKNRQSVWAPASPLLPILMFELIWGNQLLLLIQISCWQNLLIQNSCLPGLECCSSDVTDQLEQQQGSSKFKQASFEVHFTQHKNEIQQNEIQMTVMKLFFYCMLTVDDIIH